MINAERLALSSALLRPTRAVHLVNEHPDVAYDLNEAQETLFGESNDQLLLVGSARSRKSEILEWLADSIDGAGPGGDEVMYLDFTHPPLQGLDIARLVAERLAKATGTLFVFMNEIQVLGDWHAFLGYLHDSHPRVRLAATSSLSGPVHTKLYEEPLDHCKVVVLSERHISNRKAHSDGFGVHNGLKYNIKFGEVEIKGLTKAAKHLAKVDVPAEIDGRPVTVIASGAFHDRSTLLDVSLPPSIKSIGDYAFSRCVSLKRITLPKGLQHIGENAFLGCVVLDVIEGGTDLNHIGNGALLGTGWLRRQKEGLVTLGKVLYAYSGRDELVLIPEWIEAIADYAFAFNDSIRQISVANPDCDFGEGIAYGCCRLRHFSLFGRRGTVRPLSFAHCVELQSVDMCVTGAVGDFAFFGCNRLERLRMDGLVQVGHCAFLGCTGLRGFDGPHVVTVAGNGSYFETTLFEPDPSYLARSELIGHFAFAKSKIRHLTLECAVEIGGWAFADCANLLSVQVSQPQRIGPSPFEGCHAISEMSVDGTRRLASLFGGPGRVPGTLRTVNITGREIAVNFARGCKSLETLRVAATVIDWGAWAFQGCTGLAAVELEEGVTTVGDWAFAYCSSLSAISLPGSVSEIGMNAFRYCNALQDVTLLAGPGAVNLRVNAFYANHPNQTFLVSATLMCWCRNEPSWREHWSSMRPLHED